MDDGQKTPRGHPDFNSYVKNLLVFGIPDRQTDRQTEILIRVGFPHYVPPGMINPGVIVEMLQK